MKFPKRLRHRNKGNVLAAIYHTKGSKNFTLYWRIRDAAGKPKSRMRDFKTYTEAKREGDKVVSDLAKGRATVLLPGQLSDAQNAIEELQRFFQATGKRVSIRFAVGEFCEAARRLAGRTLGEAVTGFLSNIASVKRKDLAEAVEEFVATDKPRTVAHDGQRPEIGPGYAKQKANMLRKLSAMFVNTGVCDLSKTHLNAFIAALPKMKKRPATSPKSRNHHRTAIGQFLRWCVRCDYLPVTHRLLEADAMRPEKTNGGDTEFYTPKEFRALLETADGAMRAMIAIGGLAGLRTAELLRLDWKEVFGVPGHLEITAGKSKTRQRRLVEIVPALAQWLAPFRQSTSGRLWDTTESKFQKRFDAIAESAGVPRVRNGLRHAFCTYHLALNGNENATALQAGNTPGLLHGHYKGLATRKEAQAWFAVKPAKSKDNIIQLKAAQ